MSKLEMARNYWDEMGRGKPSAMHGPMLDRLARELGVDELSEPVVWESAALANLLVGLADAARGRRALLRAVPARVRSLISLCSLYY
ncbi:MAG TPA: iron-containing redox enzyme family protein [Thermoanaerobaculia bacterium]|nr:iron-containing redox enzyme family protein [Thermoanaerobaculia bacterium]